MSDRQVHARMANGAEIVRYDRAGKWYLEHVDGSRCRLTVSEAARQAAQAASVVYLNRPGGQTFVSKVLALRDAKDGQR